MSGTYWRALPAPTTVLGKHRFVGTERSFVSFNYGDELEVTHESQNWLRGRSLVTRQPGVFPTLYTTRADDPSTQQQQQQHDPSLGEINQTVHQWGVLLGHHVQTRALGAFEDLKNRAGSLLEHRRVLLDSATTSDDERKLIVARALDEIDRAVRELGLDVVVRLPSRIPASLLNTGAFSLLSLHLDQASSSSSGAAQQAASAETKKPAKGSIKMKTISDIAAITNTTTGMSGSGSISGVAASSRGPGGLYQLWVQLWMVLADVGAEFEVRMALYNRSSGQYLTEEWVVVYDAETQPVDRPRELGKIFAIFRDIEGTELSTGEIFVVTRIVRRGTFNLEGRQKGKVDRPLRRPFAAGVARLDKVHATEAEIETRIDLFAGIEANFGTLPEMLIGETRDPEIKPAAKTKGIILKARIYGSDFDDLLSSNPILKEADVVGMLKIPDVVMPGTIRNDVYLTLEEAELSEKNVEITVIVRRNSDLVGQINGCISAGERSLDSYRSTILSSSSPRWRETIRIRIDEASLLDSHVFFELRHISGDTSKNAKPFGYSFLRLAEARTVIRGDRQRIPVYKHHHGGKPSDASVGYLEDMEKKELRSSFLTVSAKISSTLFSQNEHLIRLFAWRENPAGIQDILRKLTFVNNEEIVKHLELVFQALFDMLEAKEDNPDVQQIIYDAVLFTIGKLTESRSAWNFRPVLDCFVSSRYKGTGQHSPLLRCLGAALQNLDSPQKLQAINASMKVLDYIWMIIIQSRLNYNTQNNLSTQRDDIFKKSLMRFLESLKAVMARDAKTLIAAQNSGFRHFPAILKGMTKFFQPIELCDVIVEFLTTSERLAGLPKIVSAKLGLYATLAAGEFFAAADTRARLFPPMVGFLQRQLERSVADLDARAARGGAESAAAILASPGSVESKLEDKEQRISEGSRCMEIFGVFVDILQMRAQQAERERHVPLLLQLLPALLAFNVHLVARTEEKHAAALSRTMTRQQMLNQPKPPMSREEQCVLVVVLGILRLTSPDMWEAHFVRHLKDDTERTRLCSILFEYLSATVERAPFPRQWGTMLGLQYATMLKLANILEASPWFRKSAQAYNSTATEACDPDATRMWAGFFAFGMAFVRSQALTSANVSLLMLERFGDLRAPMSGVIRRIWKLFSKKYLAFPSMVSHLLALMNVDQKTVKANALEAYFGALQCEFADTGKVEAIKGLTVDAFDMAVGMFQHSFSEFFFGSLQPRFQQANMTALWENFRSLQSYLDLICAYEASPDDPENGDARIGALHNLLEYLRANNRRLPFIKYVHILCELHLRMQNYTEAGLSFMLHADLYTWADNKELPAMRVDNLFDFPAQPACMLRETLLNMAVSYLEQGSALEHAIALEQDVAAFNETIQYNFRFAAQALRTQARMYRKLVEEERLPVSYYRVGFYGTSLPLTIRNKEFIYKGKPLEKIADFQARLLAQYPGSEALKKTDMPGPEVTEAAPPRLLITAVNESSVADFQAILGNEKPPQLLADHQKAAEALPAVSVFCYTKPFRKTKQGPEENEFQGLWLSQLYLVARYPFPSTRTRTEVVIRREVTYTPLENAVRSVREKNNELLTLIDKYEGVGGNGVSLQPLVMALNGVICAAVNGGITKYKEAFLSEAYFRSNPSDADGIARLRQAIDLQIGILYRGMTVFDMRCTADMRSLYEVLQGNLEQTRASWESGNIAAITPTPGELQRHAAPTSAEVYISPVSAPGTPGTPRFTPRASGAP